MAKTFKSFKDMAQSGQLDPDDNSELKAGPGKRSRKMASFWKDQIDQVDQLQKVWLERGDNIIKRFRDERGQVAVKDRRLNVLWSNTKVLMPALYGKPPIPYVERKFLQRDPVGRTSSIILERTTKNELEDNGLHKSIKRAVLDYLLPGRGAVWIRYEPEIGNGDSLPVDSEGSYEDDLKEIYPDSDDSPESEKLENTEEQILTEQIPVDYIHWKDLYLFPATARTWDEVQAVGKRVLISKEEAIERFGEEVGENMQFMNITSDKDRRLPFVDTAIFQARKDKSIEVFEIWNKVDRNVYWISSGYEYLCKVLKDPLKLKSFFPTPEIISATITNESMVPVPDYIEYQDQAIQIDELTKRLAMLTKACKIAGCYDGSNGALKRLLQEGFENDLIAVDAWAAFAEKGGVQGGIALLPIDEIQKVIQTLTGVRQQLMMDLDLVTGISDVLRGTTDSRETLGGIRLKNNNAGTRLSDRQNEIAKFVRDTVAIVAEIAAKKYSSNKLIEASGILYDDDMQVDSVLEELSDPPTMQNQQNQQGQQNQPPMPMGVPPNNVNNLMPSSNMLGNQLQQGNPTNVIPFPNMPPSNMQLPNPMMGMQLGPTRQDAVEVIIDRIMSAIDLLRKDAPRNYRIDIETDSTIFGDAAQEREDATTFVKEVTGFLQGAAQLGAELPEAIPVLGRMLQWGVRKFRVGRDLESALDDFVRKVDKRVKDQLKNPKPNPEEQKAQIEMAKTQAETQQQREKHQLEMQTQQANDARDAQKQQADDQRQAQLDQMKLASEREMNTMKMQIEREKANNELKKTQLEGQIMLAEHDIKMKEIQAGLMEKSVQHQQTMEQNEQQAALQQQQHQQSLEQGEQKAKQAEAQHKQKMQQAKTNKNKPKSKGKAA